MYLERENIKIIVPTNNQDLFYASKIYLQNKLTPKVF